MPSPIISGAGGGGGITNSAPANTIPVTIDGDGNLGDSSITLEEVGSSLEVFFNVPENGTVQLEATGLGTQIQLTAADGDADHVGGEVSISSGDSAGQSAGQINIIAGDDSGGGDGGNIVISSGGATFAGEGGEGGSIDIRANPDGPSDDDGGNVNIVAGASLDGNGGNVVLQPGNSTNGTKGTVQVNSALGASSLELAEGSLSVLSPVVDLAATTSINLTTPVVTINSVLMMPAIVTNSSPTTGQTVSAGTAKLDETLYITPAGTLLALTVTLPASANSRVGQIVRGFISQIITGLTVDVSGGGTIVGATPVTSAVNSTFAYQCVSTASTGTWIRIQ